MAPDVERSLKISHYRESLLIGYSRGVTLDQLLQGVVPDVERSLKLSHDRESLLISYSREVTLDQLL